MNMLTSSNQYLRPEYLSPLPTTLDAKKSPLALLAQTCSNIGADNPNNKPIIPPLEKSKDGEKNKDKGSSDDKPAFKPYESSKKDESNSDSNDKKTPMSKTSTPIAGSCSPAGGSNASCGKASPSGSDTGSTNVKSETATTTSSSSVNSSMPLSNVTSASQNTLSGLGYGSAAALSLDLARTDSVKDGLSSMSHLALGAYKTGLNPLTSCTGCATVGGHISLDGSHGFPPGLGQNGTLKPGNYPLGSALSPYVGYARVKTASGGTTLVPVCRDPYCTNCQLSMQSAQLSTCPSGCTQCTHERMTSPLSAAAVAAAAGLPGLTPGLVPGLAGSGSPAVSGAAVPGLNSHFYTHSMLPRPNVCSWMVGDTYCGKRFTTSEELLQHLRTHTNLSAGEGSLSLISPSLSMPSAVGLGACHLHYSTATSLTSPAGLRRTYPTSLSPVSSLSAASRYHPYKPPLPTLPGAPLPPLPHPGLGMYYSPYSIYGQRLGPPVHP
ncbi:zinc finger protein Noc-like [Centruroides vittatus]|uniref:zinc finger protein Noc-like n=1 Tax=Centruroides sculpturatus TaxID=218467 RepID=UPI000C6D3761|nr:zinc finger protein Noc-like [Centruroides sculpturatus]